jgi:iron complex transport system ATP-binding protein
MKLEVEHLSFSYGAKPVLEAVSFTARGGDCLAILGPNGAGKSTLLHCIDRLLPPASGHIRLDGQEITALKPGEFSRRVAFVPQEPAFAQGTVFDAVLLGRKPCFRWEAGAEDLAAVEKTLSDLGLVPLAMRSVDQLSGGERQRVAVARALVSQPQVLLLDEPTSNLDMKHQMETVTLLRTVTRNSGACVLVTMHDLGLAVRFADAFLLMKDGRVFAAGGQEIITPDTLRAVYDLDVTVAQVEGQTVVVPLPDTTQGTQSTQSAQGAQEW